MAADNELSELVMRFRIAMAQWRSDLDEADRLFDAKKAKWQTPIQLGGAAGGGAGIGSGAPMIAPGVPAASGPSSSAATAAMNNAVATTQMQHAAVQGSTQAAGFNFPSIASPGGPTVLGMRKGGMGWPGNAIGPGAFQPGEIRGVPGVAATFGQAMYNGPVVGATPTPLRTGGNVPGFMLPTPFMRHDPQVASLTAGSTAPDTRTFNRQSNLSRWLGSNLGDVISGQMTPITPGSGGGGNVPLQGKTALRNLVYGTIYGLVADVVMHGVGEYSMYNQNMTLSGGNPAAQARAQMGGVRNTLASIPIIGSGLAAVAGAAGYNQIETRLQLAERQQSAQDSQFNTQMETRQSRLRAAATGAGGGLGSTLLGKEAQLKAIQLKTAAENNIEIEKVRAANPESDQQSAVSRGARFAMMVTPFALFGATGFGGSGEEGGMDERRRQALVRANRIADDKMQGATAEVKAQIAEARREFRYTQETTQAEVNRTDISNLFRPGRAAGRYAEEMTGADLSRMRQLSGLRKGDYELQAGNIALRRNDLVQQQRADIEQFIYGSVSQYNPYTESPLANMDRSIEGPADHFNELQKSIDALTAAINQVNNMGANAPV